MRKLLLILISSYSLFASSAYISAVDLADELSNPNNKIVLLDITDKDEYNQAHIPNAIRTNIKKFRRSVLLHKEIKSPLEIQMLARSYGINNDTKVVIYDHGKKKEILIASYIAMAFITHGIKDIAILDGGFDAWTEENEKLVSTKIPYVKLGNFTAKFDNKTIVNRRYIKKRVGKVTMLDSRPPRYYFGSLLSGGVERYGHIPYAISSFWGDKFTNEKYIREKDVLEEMFITANNISKDQEVILYCTGGLETAANWYILYQHLGFKKARLYDGGLRDWGNVDDTPLVRYKWECPSTLQR